jgi:transcriptional regulator with XRE-family HTH domain
MANSQAREEFSKRLRKALQDRGREGGSPTRLTQEFNSDYPDRRVTPQAMRKWLTGEAIPSHDKVQALAEWLEVSPNWLHHGEGGAGHGAQQTAATYRTPVPDQELLRRYRKLNSRQQQAVAEIITALAAKDRRR